MEIPSETVPVRYDGAPADLAAVELQTHGGSGRVLEKFAAFLKEARTISAKQAVEHLTAPQVDPLAQEFAAWEARDPQLSNWADRVERLEKISSALRSAGNDARLVGEAVEEAGVRWEEFESIATRFQRPVFSICDDEVHFAGGQYWDEILTPECRGGLAKASTSVGRVVAFSQIHPCLPFYGSGFRPGEDLFVTNRHVLLGAPELGIQPLVQQKDGRWTVADSFEVVVDFRTNSRSCRPKDPLAFATVSEVVAISEDRLTDIAILRLSPAPGKRLPPPLPVALEKPANWTQVYHASAVIGFPARDVREPLDIDEVFGSGRLESKCLAVGYINGQESGSCRYPDYRWPHFYFHDCATLGGNSGSPVIDLKTNQVVALHFGGISSEERKFCSEVRQRLNGNKALPLWALGDNIKTLLSEKKN